MIIILEGTERTGKTTFAKELEKEGFINFKDIIHINSFNLFEYKTGEIDNRIDAITNFLSKLDKANINVVVDRFHISNAVYAKHYHSNKQSEVYGFIDLVLSKMNVKLYLFERFDHSYYKNHPVLSDKEEIVDLQNDFSYYFDKSEIAKKRKVDISKIDMNLLIDEAIERDVLSEIEDNWPKEFDYDFYLASPFFNEEQKERENSIKQIIRSYGFSVYAPLEHGKIDSCSSNDFCRETFNSNIEAIQKCRYVLAITDGKDMGTIWEAGYAYGIGKPVIYYAETLGKAPFNIMLSESGYGIFKGRIILKDALKNNKLNHREEVNHE